jgi:CTP:molybdopterin cytidylyltransferase MocA
MPALCGVILAAGASTRMGTDKALLPWPSNTNEETTLLSAQIHALQPYTQAVIVVAGRNADQLASVIEACGAAMMVNPDPERGQFSSLQTGLRALEERGFHAAMITPVDCPPLSASSLDKLCGAFEPALTRGLWAVAPEHAGRHGHPLLAGPSWIEAILREPVTSNARAVKHAHAKYLASVPVPDGQLSADMNTPEEYAALAARSHARNSS